ncbi:MAG TPA: hypothetical protein VN278_06035 [Methanosarcina sp.]|nr:hypothetical protein [Methanosarcina sp.]
MAMPYQIIRIPGYQGEEAADLPFTPINSGTLDNLSGQPISATIPPSAEMGEIIGLLEEVVDQEGIVYIDGVRVWTRSKVVDKPS